MKELSPETRLFIREHQNDDVRSLALQAGKYPAVDMPAAITQIAGIRIAKEKVPSWSNVEGIRYPHHLSMEQCSSDRKSTRLNSSHANISYAVFCLKKKKKMDGH